MSTISSHTGQGNAADVVISNTALASASEFDVVIPAQAGGLSVAIDTYLRVLLPANHGGLRINWRVPLRLSDQTWPLAELREDWIAYDVMSTEPGQRLIVPSVNDPQHTDAITISPGAVARTLRINCSHLFRSPAAGATISLQAAKTSSGASPTLLAKSHIEIRMFT